MTQESTNFCLSSVGRNRFLQRPAGLFGGDEWTLGTYTAVDNHYRRSDVYSRTITSWNESTNAALYQREPVACWYTMGVATVREVVADTVTAQWALSTAVWNSVRVPGQCVTVVLDGRTVHATVTAASTPALLVATLPATALAWAPAFLRPGLTLPYMVRNRPPGATLGGPLVRTGPTTVLVQAPTGAVPTGRQALLYLGGRSGHPVRTCALQAPAAAAASIYGVVDVRVAAAGPARLALRSTAAPLAAEAWTQVTQHLAVGALRLSAAVAPTGYSYVWPYPSDQTGHAWLLASAAPAPPVDRPPAHVWFVRAASTAVDPVAGTVDGGAAVALRDGDRVMQLGPAAAGGAAPVQLYEWDAAARTLVAGPPLPDDVLVVVEPAPAAAPAAGVGAWRRGGPTGVWRDYRLLARGAHPQGAAGADVDLAEAAALAGAATDAPEAVGVWDVLVLLVRAADGLYAPTPTAVGTNMYDKADPV